MTQPTETIPGLTALIGLTGAEQIWCNLAGSDYRLTTDQIAALATGDIVIPGIYTYVTANQYMGLTLVYGVASSVGAITLTLPPLVRGGAFFVFDVDNNAASNNITIVPSGSDSIRYYGSPIASLSLNLNSSAMAFLSSGGVWRAVALSVL